MPLAGWDNTSVFLMLIVRPNLRAAVEKQSHRRCSASGESATSAQSSANSNSQIFDIITFVSALKCPVLMLQSLSSGRDFTNNIMEKKIENNVGAITQPCFVPLVTSNGGDFSLPSLTVTFMPSWNERIIPTKCLGQPAFNRISHNPSLCTVSKALVRSMNNRYRSWECNLHFSCNCLSEKVMSVVPFPG